MRRIIIFLIVGIIGMVSIVFGMFKHDYTCIVFPAQCTDDSDIQELTNGIKTTPKLGQLIPEAAVNFMESTRDYEDFLKGVEKSEIYGFNYPLFQESIEKAIIAMERAHCVYEQIVNTTENLEMEVFILERLNQFDYDGLRSRYNLNPSIFAKSAAFCQSGDIRGIYNHTFATVRKILDNLYKIKSILENETMPELKIMWETSQLYFESKMFGQYTSIILYEIYLEVNKK